MKRGLNIMLIMCAVLAMLSCSKTKSYTDRLNDQKKAINKLIAAENFEILYDYPKDGVFGPNQFVKLSSGVYMNVVDSGNGNRATMYKTHVLSRFTVQYVGDTATISNYGPHSNGISPVEFQYGYYDSAIVGSVITGEEQNLNSVMSEGFQTALQYVGDQAIVKLIVPFQVGSTVQSQVYQALYFQVVQYKFLE